VIIYHAVWLYLHFRDKAGLIANVLMHVPAVYGHDRPAVGMTINQHASPGLLVRERGFDFWQFQWKDGPKQLMRCAAESLRAG
jgi:hypothetical protein